MKKRILSIVLALCMMITLVPTTVFAEQAYIAGDIDFDGQVTVKDSVLLQKYLVGLIELEEIQIARIDNNGDGNKNIFDCTNILKLISDLDVSSGGAQQTGKTPPTIISSAGSGDTLKVNATSNYFPTVSTTSKVTVEQDQNGTNYVTVTYFIDSTKDVLDLQWTLTYDPAYLQFADIPPEVSSILNLMPMLRDEYHDNKYYYNVISDGDTNQIKANAVDLDLCKFADKGSVPFVTATFLVVNPGETEVNLFVDCLTLSDGTTEETAVNSGVVNEEITHPNRFTAAYGIDDIDEHICMDFNKDHKCDYYGCGVSISSCDYKNYAHKCDYCGANISFDNIADSKYTQACESIDSQYHYSQHDLGATYTSESTTFKVWAPTATKVVVNLYAYGTAEESRKNGVDDKLGTYEMTYDETTGVWQITLEGDFRNVYYIYTITALKVGTSGGATTKETQDIYSVATGVNGKRSMVCDLDSTDPEGWENDDHVLLDESTDSVVWELHIKDFSYDPASGVSKDNRGKYLAFTETGTTLNGEGNVSTCIDYLKELGVTTVKINPFFDFGSIDEKGSDTQLNWGYDPQNFNVPEGSYSSNPYDGNKRIEECKSMIMALHDAGISVVMDVDYTHTMSTDSCFQATVPNYYYRMTKTGAFSNGSGYGNECATERAMYREFIIQSLLYWANEYHIDGFNFDSMALMDVETMNLIREALDGVDPRITTWGEGWADGASYHPTNTCTGAKYYPATQANAAMLNDRIALFNDVIRDGIKGGLSKQGFIQGAKTSAPDIRYGVRANSFGRYKWLASAPSQCVSYASCHDNATLYDRILGSTGLASYGVRESTAVKMNKLGGAIVYTSQGVAFMLAGEEMCRSKDGDTNSYKSAATCNMIKWQNVVDYADVVSYYKGLSNIRNRFTPLTCADNSYSDAYIFNGNMIDASKQIAFTIANDTPGEWSKMAVIYNSDSAPAEITLKDTSVTEWVVIANGDSAGVTKLAEVSGSTFSVPAYSALIAVEKSSYESAGIDENTGKVIVNYLYEDGKTKLADSIILKGTIGTGYETVKSPEISGKYLVKEVIGNTNGKFAQEDAVVNYIYENIPIIVVGNGSGNWLNGADWDCTSVTNRMTAVSPLVYEITYAEIAQGNNYKCSFSISGKEEYVFENETTVTVPYELADVTLRLDLTDFDCDARKGAKLTVTVNPHHDHDFSGDWDYDGTYHWHNCQNGDCKEIQDRAKHSGGTATCTKKAFCEFCDAEYGERSTDNHTGTKVWEKNEKQHKQYWNCCDAVVVDYEDHAWVDGVCSRCDYTCAHRDISPKDHVCDICGKTLSSHTGGTASYFKKAVCEYCNKEYGELLTDTTAPTGEITVGTNKWNSFLNTITFGVFFKDIQSVTITASDDSYSHNGYTDDKAVKVEYYLYSGEPALTEADLAGKEFTEYSRAFNINPDNQYVVYARLTDFAGNVTYLSSEGVVLDATAPVISGVENGKVYCEAQTVTVTEEYIKSVTVNGTEVLLDANNQFTLTPADGTQTIVVTDQAGNETSVTVTVNNGHTDENTDHACDYCDTNVGTHADTNRDHKCDYGCSVAIGAHEDTNSDHKCDYGCSEAIGVHEDTNNDHKCDYGCSEAIGTHEDNNNDHKCDYGCSEAIGVHEDTNNDHKCDYGCSVAIGVHADNNSDHKCDYGCDEPFGEHKVADGKHTCDYCGEEMTTCTDDDKDHLCDVCNTKLSEHTGGEATCTNKAICEYCGEEYGEIDSANHNLEKIPAKAATVIETGNEEYWHCKDCGKYFADEKGTDEIELNDTVTQKLPPEIIEGKGQSITAEEMKELTFRSNAAFNDFIRVELDGKILDENNYTVKEGSTIVTLKADYVATLSAGEHTIGIVSESGTATTTFTVNAKAVDDPSQTEDDTTKPSQTEDTTKPSQTEDTTKPSQIEDTTKPSQVENIKSPQTGNDINSVLWLALLLVSGGLITVTSVYGKRKKQRGQ